jgi:hypothetical protein
MGGGRGDGEWEQEENVQDITFVYHLLVPRRYNLGPYALSQSVEHSHQSLFYRL